ncbi:arabinogalactan protein 13-like [Euphorbia lathyris]|uniref:arabinogalactan protein 13-like n=1 Tax=Euphorbia lathyris TaxID=212925 RepID=UPI003313F7C5
MEALKMRVFMAIVVVLMAISAVSAQESPAPSPASDATTFVPAAFASLVALAFGVFF